MKNKIYGFRNTTFIAIMVLISCVTLSKQAISQENEIRYALMEYIKVKPENIEKYLGLVRDFWKPVQQERINQNEILGWRMFRICFTGTLDDYNFVTAVFFSDFAKIENAENSDFRKVYPGKNTNDMKKEFLKVGDLVKTEILEKNLNLSTINSSHGKYLWINFMNVKQGEEDNYLEVENSIWKPVHQELVNSKAKTGWDIWRMVLPGGSDSKYKFMAVDAYSDFLQIDKVDYSEVFKKVHSNQEINALFKKTSDSRQFVKAEIW